MMRSPAKPVERAAQYLVRNTHLLHYDPALTDGLPIATGMIEGGLSLPRQGSDGPHRRTLVVDGRGGCIAARALRASGHFDDYW
jgi:hypothetical protein